MAIEHVQRELLAFLASTEPEVVCLKGQWGVGKTYAWNLYRHQAIRNQAVGLKKYSYISLFGISSIEELQFKIYQGLDPISPDSSESTLYEKSKDKAGKAWRFGKQKVMPLLSKAPPTKNWTDTLNLILADYNISKTVICIDDIERRSPKLLMRDILGFISNLRHSKNCKVLLILNEDADDPEKNEWEKHYEKVIEKTLAFEPTARDSVRIAITGDSESDKELMEYCIALDIKNIRVINRIQTHVASIKTILAGFSYTVLKQAIRSIALLSWCKFQPETAPKLEYLLDRFAHRMMMSLNKTAVPEEEAKWNELLDAIGFYQMDEFDHAILDGIRSGYFDSESLVRLALPLEEKANAGASEQEIHDAWEIYHKSFDNNEEEVVSAIYTATLKNAKFTHAMSINGAVELLKALGRENLARDLIDAFINSRNWIGKPSEFRSTTEYTHITNEEFLAAVNDKLNSIVDERNPMEVLLDMIRKNAWFHEDVVRLAEISSDKYYEFFKSYNNGNLTNVIRRALQFGRFSELEERHKIIVENVTDALIRIGSESPLNEQRITKFGIKLSEKPSEIDQKSPSS